MWSPERLLDLGTQMRETLLSKLPSVPQGGSRILSLLLPCAWGAGGNAALLYSVKVERI